MNTLSPRAQHMARRAAELLEHGFVVIDFETTGFPSDPNVAIIEAAVIDHRGAVLLNTLVQPGCAIPSAASRVNGIYDDDVTDAPPFQVVYPRLLECLEGKIAIAYNHTFEQGMFKTVCARYQLAPPNADWRCAMRAYASYKSLRGFASLSKACAAEGITTADAHRALGDCRMTLALVYSMASHV
jgi:DNA polymerase-3 subunit epsilon